MFLPLSTASSVCESIQQFFHPITALAVPTCPVPPPAQVQQMRSTRQNRGDWAGRDVEVEVEVVGSDEREEEDGARWVEARREG